MKAVRTLLLILFFQLGVVFQSGVFFQSRAFAASDESRSALSDLEKNVRMFTLPNGLRVLMHRRGVAPVFGGVVTVRVGSVNELQGHTGISHMLEHMAFKGTPSIGTKDYRRERALLDKTEEIRSLMGTNGRSLDDDRAALAEIDNELASIWDVEQFDRLYKERGASDLNATTGSELTNYYVEFPRPAFEFWCWIESERILHPVMRQFYKERDVVMEERRMRFDDSPQGKLFETLLGVAYLSHPYRNPVIGYAFDIESLTASKTAEYQAKYYVAENMVVSIVGDVNPETDIKTVEKYFGRIPQGPVPARPAIVEEKQIGERSVTVKMKASPELIVAYKKPAYPDPDDVTITLMAELLAGSRISPLYKELVRKKQVAAGIGHYEVPGVAYPSLLVFEATVKNPTTNDELLSAFDSVVERFKHTMISADELSIAKRSIAMEYMERLKENVSLASDLASSEILFGDWKTLIRWFDTMLQVTPEQVQAAAQQYLNKSTRTVARVETKA